jgi:hypothetical protein
MPIMFFIKTLLAQNPFGNLNIEGRLKRKNPRLTNKMGQENKYANI